MVQNDCINKDRDLEFLLDDDAEQHQDIEADKYQSGSEGDSDAEPHSFASQQWPQSYKYILITVHFSLCTVFLFLVRCIFHGCSPSWSTVMTFGVLVVSLACFGFFMFLSGEIFSVGFSIFFFKHEVFI